MSENFKSQNSNLYTFEVTNSTNSSVFAPNMSFQSESKSYWENDNFTQCILKYNQKVEICRSARRPKSR